MPIPKNVEMVPVVSSNLKAVGYDADSKTLYVQFTDGAAYKYAGVSAQKHNALMIAPSKGVFFTNAIRTKYSFEKVEV